MRGNLMKQRNQIEQGKYPSLTQGVQDLVHAGDGELAEGADLVEFLLVDEDPNAPRLIRDDHQRDRIRRGRVLCQACREVLVQGGVNFLRQNRVDPLGSGSKMRAAFPDRNLRRHQGVGTKIRLGDLEKTSAKLQRTSPSCSTANGVHPGPWRLNPTARRCDGSRS